MSARHRDADLPPGTRRILHLDVDAFLASVEEAVHPELRGKPVVVGGSPRSRNLVMSCSYVARRSGVRPGMHLSEAARRCPRAIFRDGDSQAANRLREETTRLLLGFTPLVEVASIDDFFVDLTGTARLHGPACGAAETIRAAIADQVHLPVTVGVATNKTLARLAGKLAKPGGVAEILPGGEDAFLASLPVHHLPGVGHSIGARLERFAIHTVGELRLVSRELLFATFGRPGLSLFDLCRGRDERPVEPTHHVDDADRLVARLPRTIRRETTFEPEEGRRELVEAMLAYLVDRATHRLRAHGAVASALEVHVRYVDTRPRMEAASVPRDTASQSRRGSVKRPTDSTDELWLLARSLLRGLPRRRALVKRIGVLLTNLRRGTGWQGRLFSEPEADRSPDEPGARGSRADRQRRLDASLDRLRARLGFGLVVRGSSAPLKETHPLQPDGFKLRTPSLNQ